MAQVLNSIETEIRCRDDAHLRATVWRPAHSNGAVVQINSALAVPRRYYQSFAQYLAERGFAVLCYDYRGIGESLYTHPRLSSALFSELGEQDMAAAVDYVKKQFPDHRHIVVGHSAGAALFGLAPNCDAVDAVYAVAAPSAWTGHYDWPQKLSVWSFFNVFIPLTTPLWGYFPGQFFGTGPLPKGIARQWSQWAQKPDYVVDNAGMAMREHYHRCRQPMRFIHLTDDKLYAPLRSVQAVASFYQNAPRQILSLSPKSVGVKKIGHFGFFRKHMPESVWQSAAAWMMNPHMPS